MENSIPYSAINLSNGSVPIFKISDIHFGSIPLLGPNTIVNIPFNRLIKISIPSRNNTTSKIIDDRNGKRWTLSVFWRSVSGEDHIFVKLKIDGVGEFEEDSGETSGRFIGSELIVLFVFTDNGDIGLWFYLSTAFGATTVRHNRGKGFFVNNITLDTGVTLTLPALPAGTTLDSFKETFYTNEYDVIYYYNCSDDGITIEFAGNGSLDTYPAQYIRLEILYNTPLASYIFYNVTPDPIPIPPYGPIDDSEPDGGDGTYDFDSSDDIDFPPLPQISANVAGFISLWSPKNDQLLSLASYLWNDDVLSSNFWKKLIANPIDLIFGLSIIPLDLTDYIDGTYSVVVGLLDTKIRMRHLNTQWVSFDCGEIDLSETWGAYLDYDPFTKLEIYLPFCGTHPLKVDDFMPGKIRVVYHIDLLTGSCIAMVKSTKTNRHNDVLNSVVYQFMGNCATQIPVSSQQFADAVRSAVSIAASIGTMIATGVGGSATPSSIINTGASAVENVMNIKPSIERTGAMGSSGSLLAVRTPYIILTRPRQAKPDEQYVYTGYPSFITETLGDLNGWTIVQAIHLNNIPCTSAEMNEIDELLKGGVIF